MPADGDGAEGGEGSLRALLPVYFDFLATMKSRGFLFMDFATFWQANKHDLPEKLLVVRHDVHARDVNAAYSMRKIERFMLQPQSATYFVLLGFPPETNNSQRQRQYSKLIDWLKKQDVDVQPHISPTDMYVTAYQPEWSKSSLAELQALTKGNYVIDQRDDGIDIDAIPHDALDLRLMNGRLVPLLSRYNERWTALTGLKVGYYAAHGSHLPLNLVMNNATLLDQRELLATGIYQFDTYNTQVQKYVGYLSDNEEDSWMDHPETIEPGRYEFLAHPYLWTDKTAEKRRAREQATSSNGGASP